MEELPVKAGINLDKDGKTLTYYYGCCSCSDFSQIFVINCIDYFSVFGIIILKVSPTYKWRS